MPTLQSKVFSIWFSRYSGLGLISPLFQSIASKGLKSHRIHSFDFFVATFLSCMFQHRILTSPYSAVLDLPRKKRPCLFSRHSINKERSFGFPFMVPQKSWPPEREVYWKNWPISVAPSSKRSFSAWPIARSAGRLWCIRTSFSVSAIKITDSSSLKQICFLIFFLRTRPLFLFKRLITPLSSLVPPSFVMAKKEGHG